MWDMYTQFVLATTTTIVICIILSLLLIFCIPYSLFPMSYFRISSKYNYGGDGNVEKLSIFILSCLMRKTPSINFTQKKL